MKPELIEIIEAEIELQKGMDKLFKIKHRIIRECKHENRVKTDSIYERCTDCYSLLCGTEEKGFTILMVGSYSGYKKYKEEQEKKESIEGK